MQEPDPLRPHPGEVWRSEDREGPVFPFGYYLEHSPGLLVLRRPDGTFVAVFPTVAADPFEIELAVWEDAD